VQVLPSYEVNNWILLSLFCKPQSQFAALSIPFSAGDTIIKLQLLVQFFLAIIKVSCALMNQNTITIQLIVVIKCDRGYCHSIGVSFSTGVRTVAINQ